MLSKQQVFVEAIANLQPDVFCLQEVNQSQGAQEVKPLKNQIQIQDTIKLRQDNHAYTIVKMLEGKGIHYEWVWRQSKLAMESMMKGRDLFKETDLGSGRSSCFSKQKLFKLSDETASRHPQ